MRGLVVCVSPIAAEEGAEVLEAGGNAFDAAVATCFVQMIVLPFSCGLGGFLSAHLYSPSRERHEIVDGCLRAGSLVTDDMWAHDYRGESAFLGASLFDDLRSDIGYTSICTPGAVSALDQVHRRHCSLPWADLLRPAIRIAQEGFTVSPAMRRSVLQQPPSPHPDGLTRIKATQACSRILLDSAGNFPEVGTILKNSDYANSLEHLSIHGAQDFYTGELAASMREDLKKNGAFVTGDDLRDYQASLYSPVSGQYGEYRIFSNRAPGGGPLFIEALNTLDGVELQRWTHGNVDVLSCLASTLQLVHQDRRSFLGDPEVIGKEPEEVLLSARRAAQIRETVQSGIVGASPPAPEDLDTAHVSVVDEEGNIAAITHSLGWYSGVVTPGLGFLYNNGMNRFDPRPNQASSLAPRKARLHLMMPSIAFKQGKPRIVLGAPGGNAILSALVQGFINVVDFKMTAAEAVSAPRIHAEGKAIWCEARHRSEVCDRLRSRGYEVNQSPDRFAGNIASMQLIIKGPNGDLDGASDPRGEAGVARA